MRGICGHQCVLRNNGLDPVKKSLHSFADSPAYKKWVGERDKALEVLHINAQLKATDQMRRALSEVLILAKAYYEELKTQAHTVDRFEQQVKDSMRRAGHALALIYMNLRTSAYTLARASETEIVARMKCGQRVDNLITRHDIIQHLNEDSAAGGPMEKRIALYMDRLARKIVNQAQASALIAKDQHKFLFSVLQAFPQRKVYKRPPRILKPKLMEAGKLPKDLQGAVANARASLEQGATTSSASDFIDQDVWDQMLKDYMDENIPEWRAPEHIIDIPVTDPTITATGEDVWYAWEFERDLTQEFVQSVRDGQIAGANQAGIVDFVWIAIIDSKTDACCLWRDGLLISEIESKLDQHQAEDEECNIDSDGLNPPLHFNCRCTLAPATENIPDKPDDGAAQFDDWLMS